MRHLYLLGCLVLSGFAGLAYEFLWVRLLSFIFGSTTLSFSTVLAVFFGGLALGAYLAGRRAKSVKRPARVYGYIELLTGVCGLLLYPVLTGVVPHLFAAIDPGPGLAGAFVRLLFAAPLLLIPTVLMGATLPMVTAAMIHKSSDIGRGTALIYGFNTFGAFLGAYLVTYYLLPGLGIFVATIVIALTNFVVGGVTLILERREAEQPRTEVGPSDAPAESGSRKFFFVAVALTGVGGFAAICFQVVWVRLFSVFLQGTIYGVGSVLICVLIGIAIGSFLIAPMLRSTKRAALWFAGLQGATVAAVVVISELLPWIAYQLATFDRKPGGLTSLHAQLAIVFIVLFIPTVCSGASFPVLINLVEREAAKTGRTLGSLYASNTVGSILGSLAGGFILIPNSGTEGTILIALTLTAAVGAVGANLLSKITRVYGLAVAVGIMLLVSLYKGYDARLLAVGFQSKTSTSYAQDLSQREKQVKRLLYFAEAKVATVSIYNNAKTRSLSLNGLGQGGRNNAPPHHLFESLLVGLVPLLHMDSPKTALVVGLGAGVTVDLLRRFVEKTTVVELEPKVVEGVRKSIWPEEDILKPPRVEVVINDARHHLMLSSKKGTKFNLITSMPAHPWVASSMFTQEFFELSAKSLEEQGIFCTWFGIGNMDDVAVKSLMRAFVAVYPHYVIYFVRESGAYYLVGSQSPLRIDMARIRSLFDRPEFRADQLIDSPFFLPERVYATGDVSTPQPPPGIINTDDTAFVEVHAPRSSTVSPMLSGFMPAEYILPSFIAEDQRRDFYIQLMERLLGSPDGQLPMTNRPINVKAAKRLIEGIKDQLGASKLSYFEARIAYASGKKRQAQKILQKLADPRAPKFYALTFPKEQQFAKLAVLEPTTDVLVKLLDLDPERALRLVPTATVSPDADPIRWMLHASAHRSKEEIDRDQLFQVLERAGTILAKTNRLQLLNRCIALSQKAGLPHREKICLRWHNELVQKIALSLLKAGRRAGARDDFKAAQVSLQEAYDLMPGTKATLELLLRSMVENGDKAGVRRLSRELRFLGKTEDYIRYLVSQAEQGNLAADRLEKEEVEAEGMMEEVMTFE